MFAHKIYSDLKQVNPRFCLYKDIKKDERIDCDYIVCQLESLTTIKDDFDCVIFDESESNFAQFNSTTIKNFNEITKKFQTIITNAKSVVCSDAFITNRTLCLIDKLRPKGNKIYIENTFQPYDRLAYNVGNSDAKMCNFISHFIDKNPKERNIIATGSRKNSEALYSILKEESKTLLINSYSSDKIAKELQDVNAFWDNYQNVIYTSSITVGVSYDSGYHFDNLFLHFSVFASLVRDMIQASLRARYITNNTLYYTNFSNYFGSAEDRYRIFTFNELRTIISNRNESVAIDEKLDEWVMDMWSYNKLETNVNTYHHKALIDRYLMMCGYKEYDPETWGKQINVHCDVESYPYNEIDDIKTKDFEEIYLLMVKGEATKAQKLQLIKFDFNTRFNTKNFETTVVWSMFDAYLQSSTKISKIMTNINHEVGLGFLNQNDFVSVYQDNVEQKHESLKQIKSIMDIEKSFEISTIKKETIDRMKQYFDDNKEMLKNVWGITFKYKNITERATIGCIHQIYGIWCGSEFKRGKRERKRVDGNMVDVSQFVLKPSDDIEPFIRSQLSQIENNFGFMDEEDEEVVDE